MIFFKQYKNNTIPKNRKIEKIIRETINESFSGDLDEQTFDYEKVDETIEKIQEAKDKIKQDFLKNEYSADSFFDEEIFKHLDILNNFFSSYIKQFPKYYDDNGNINPRAFLDARDFIKNELNVTPELLIESEETLGGIYNDNFLHFDNGYIVDVNGTVYGPDKSVVFNPKNKHTKIDSLDFLNEKIITENLVRIDMPDDFIKDFITDNEFLDNNFKEDLEALKDKIKNKDTNEKNGTIIGKVDETYIYEDEKKFIDMKVDDTYLGDIFDEVDLISQLRRYNVESNSFGVCNIKDIPYGELNSLLFWGGGEKGVKPLAATEISDKDISFKPDGTVYYSGTNSTITVKRSGCKSKKYKTGHVMMYSNSNKIGLKRSIIQYIYWFCASVGLFNANIPKLVGFKKFKVFPGLCIGGLLEQVICAWQERLSTRINELFQCVPATYKSDCSQSGFENASFPYGSSVETLDELDKIKSVKYGDRFVVNIVPPSVTGNNADACGVFVFDPQNKLSNSYKWRYKEFSGKPYSEKDTNTIVKYESNYSNPLFEDIITNSNALGEDSITRRIMALQYAYDKKQELLTISDVEVALEASVLNIIYELLDNLTYKIANYVILDDMYDSIESDVPGQEPNQCIEETLRYFQPLFDAGVKKKPNLKDFERTYTYSTDTSENSSTITTVKYYDFSSLDKDEYVVPLRRYNSENDAIMFSLQIATNEELLALYRQNLKYIENVTSEASSFSSVKTIWDFINKSDKKEEILIDIKDNLDYIKADLEYSEYEDNAFEQVSKRCYYVLENKNLLE